MTELIGLLHFVARAPLAWAAVTAVIALVQLGSCSCGSRDVLAHS